MTLLLLDTGDRVVTAVLLQRAFAKARLELSADRQVLVCGYNFTEEAQAVLASAGSFWIAESDFHWTDERYRRIRQPRPHAENREKQR